MWTVKNLCLSRTNKGQIYNSKFLNIIIYKNQKIFWKVQKNLKKMSINVSVQLSKITCTLINVGRCMYAMYANCQILGGLIGHYNLKSQKPWKLGLRGQKIFIFKRNCPLVGV